MGRVWPDRKSGLTARCALFQRPRNKAVKQQQREHKSVFERLALVGFDEPQVVNDSENRGSIDETMQPLPVFPSQAAN